VSDCSLPVAALRLWQRTTEGEFYGELSAPAPNWGQSPHVRCGFRCNSSRTLALEVEQEYGRPVSTEQDRPLRRFLKRVGHDYPLVDKWWSGGADALFRELPDLAADLTETQKDILRRGELDEIKQALHDEGVAMGEDVSTNLGKNWALVRV
jgi:hypothetical protein